MLMILGGVLIVNFLKEEFRDPQGFYLLLV